MLTRQLKSSYLKTIFAVSGLLASLFFSSLATILSTTMLLNIAAAAVIASGAVALFMPKGESSVNVPEPDLQLAAE